MPVAELAGDGEYIGGGRASTERADVRLLDSGAIGHRIGEGHSQLNHIGTARNERVEIGRRVAIACGDETDEGRVGSGEGGGEAGQFLDFHQEMVVSVRPIQNRRSAISPTQIGCSGAQ